MPCNFAKYNITIAKAQRPRIAQFVSSVPATVAAYMPSVSTFAERVRASAQACNAARCANSNSNSNSNGNANPPRRACCLRSRKVVFGLLSLFMLIMAARYHLKHHQFHHEPSHSFHHHFQSFAGHSYYYDYDRHQYQGLWFLFFYLRD